MKFQIWNMTLNDGLTIGINLPNDQIDRLEGNLQHDLYQNLESHKDIAYRKWRHNHKYQTEIYDFD